MYDPMKACQEFLQKELEYYIEVTPMTPKERKAVEEWVADGNSVYDNMTGGVEEDGATPIPFLEDFRRDEEIREAIRGMTAEEVEKYIEEHF